MNFFCRKTVDKGIFLQTMANRNHGKRKNAIRQAQRIMKRMRALLIRIDAHPASTKAFFDDL